MNIVLICNEYPAVRPHAGIGTVVHILAHGLQGRGHEVTVVGLGETDSEISDNGIKVKIFRRCNWRYLGNLLSRVHLHRRLARLVKSGNVDVIEVPDSQGLLPFRMSGCATVVRLHLSFTCVTYVTGEKHGRGIALFERRTLTANRNWIGVSGYVLDLTRQVFGISPQRSAVVHNPAVPLPSDLATAPDLPAAYILYAGHVYSRKGADVLANAFARLTDRYPDLHLVYVGGLYTENGSRMLDRITDMLGAVRSKRVHFLGRLDRRRVLECMMGAKVFAFPSRVEGFPMVILEAMSCGLPVVYSKEPAGTELIEDGVSGLLAEPTPNDFATKISRILDDEILARKLGENARKRVADRFSEDKFLEATEHFYRLCAAQVAAQPKSRN